MLLFLVILRTLVAGLVGLAAAVLVALLLDGWWGPSLWSVLVASVLGVAVTSWIVGVIRISRRRARSIR